MQLNSIAALYGGYVDSLLSDAAQTGGVASNGTNGSSGFSASSQSADSSQLSPLAQIFSTLQLLQENNPKQYQQVTEKIAINLQRAAQAAGSSGYAIAAAQLSNLAADFTNASTSGELPDIQGLASTIAGATTQTFNPTNTEDPWNLSNTAAPSWPADPSLNPLSIILNTLSNSS